MWLKKILLKNKVKNMIPGALIPIIKCIKYKRELNEEYIKKQIVDKMLVEIKNYVVWEITEEENGISLLTGRIDVLRRDG